jgi:hypothetical protein
MTSTVSLALAKAGVALPPLNKRVWLALRDSKLPRTGVAVSQILGEARPNVASALSNLSKRGMVSATYEWQTVAVGRGRAQKQIAHYHAVGTEYELLPMPLKNSRPIAAPVAEPPKPKALRADDIDLESMKLSEAHALYKRLREFFA